MAFGQGNPGHSIKGEFKLRHAERGVLSMARSPHPDSAGSQFFICFGPQRYLDGQYAVFGKVYSGFNVVDALEKAANPRARNGENPLKKIYIKEIVILNKNDHDYKVEKVK